jgi:NADH-quinone oxidoreductase subunit N
MRGMGRLSRVSALCIGIFMFSMIGIPPLAGFWGKFYVLGSVVGSERYVLALMMICGSVIAAYYYLRVIKMMYFEHSEDLSDVKTSGSLALLSVIGFCAVVILCSPIIFTLI